MSPHEDAPPPKKSTTVFKLIGMSLAKGDLSMKINLETLLGRNLPSECI